MLAPFTWGNLSRKNCLGTFGSLGMKISAKLTVNLVHQTDSHLMLVMSRGFWGHLYKRRKIWRKIIWSWKYLRKDYYLPDSFLEAEWGGCFLISSLAEAEVCQFSCQYHCERDRAPVDPWGRAACQTQPEHDLIVSGLGLQLSCMSLFLMKWTGHGW